MADTLTIPKEPTLEETAEEVAEQARLETLISDRFRWEREHGRDLYAGERS
jgi:hypothetical protein